MQVVIAGRDVSRDPALASNLGSRMDYGLDTGAGEILGSRPITEPRFVVGDRVSLQFDPAALIRVA